MTTSRSTSRETGCPSEPARSAGRPVDEVRSQVAIALDGVRDLQRSALAIYGRLEVDRALNWTMEELGELAQAVRLGADRSRLEEELGQLAAWTLCLANILDLNLAAAVRSAIEEEIDRQLVKHGRLKPYQGRS